jgi:two-component system CheB/CheR fusion protein
MVERSTRSVRASRGSGPRKPERRAAGTSARRSTTLQSDPIRVPVIGVGASAGGLEAFSQLLSRLPATCGAAFVLAQHLDPKHESLLAELLARRSALPVIELGRRTRVQPDRVYVVPPACSLRLTGDSLHTTLKRKARGHPSLIDDFFTSLANNRGKRAVGVLLSGSGQDGVAGLEAIQAAGGTTLCQSPRSAQMPSMPQAAVSAQAADLVLDLPELADELVLIGRTLSGGALSAPGDEVVSAGHDDLAGVVAALRSQTGLDFSSYKPSTVRRRLARRMAFGKFNSITSYRRHLVEDPREAADLAEDLLIHVTRFFRDAAMFAALKRLSFPRLLRERGGNQPIRIWVPGCATGEEVYSLAISLLEYLEGSTPRPPIQIFGTDLSEQAIAKARAGLYPAKTRTDIPAALLHKYFTQADGGYQISRKVRSLCAFARHDVTLDPPFSRLDLISCRNVLIYHTVEAQHRALSMFHYALLPNGILILGSSESIGAKPDLFTPLAARERIFVKRAARTPAAFGVSVAEPTHAHPLIAERAVESSSIALLAGKQADRVLLGKYVPAAVLVDRDLQILQFRGASGPFIRPASGASSLSVLKMVHPSLSTELHRALRPVKGSIKASSTTVTIDTDGRSVDVRVEVLPIYVSQAQPQHALVVFQAAPGARADKEPKEGKTRGAVERLKSELIAAREHLQSLISEHESASEALRAALDAGQSSNEELQSTNEELETAKEELQSTNEELSTVNDELQARNLELNQLNNDLAHVLFSIDVPILTIGRDARIRRFNHAAQRALDLLPGDIGRPLPDVRTSRPAIGLAKVVAQVIKAGSAAEIEVLGPDQRPDVWHVRPYPGSAGVDGVIVTLVSSRNQASEGAESTPARAVQSARMEKTSRKRSQSAAKRRAR